MVKNQGGEGAPTLSSLRKRHGQMLRRLHAGDESALDAIKKLGELARKVQGGHRPPKRPRTQTVAGMCVAGMCVDDPKLLHTLASVYTDV